MRSRAFVPALGALVLASALLLGRGVAIPEVASACSCIGPQPLEAYAGPDTAIFAGQVVGDDPDGVRVAVEQWFSGTGAAPIVLIAGDFGNGASCGVGSRPSLGSRWIWVAWRPQGEEGIPNPLDDGVQISICQPFADLSTPEGEALLQEAIATFGGGAAPTGSPSGEAPTDGPSAAPSAPPAPGRTSRRPRSPRRLRARPPAHRARRSRSSPPGACCSSAWACWPVCCSSGAAGREHRVAAPALTLVAQLAKTAATSENETSVTTVASESVSAT